MNVLYNAEKLSANSEDWLEIVICTIELNLLYVNFISFILSTLSTCCHMWAGTIMVFIAVLLIDFLSIKDNKCRMQNVNEEKSTIK